MNLKLKPKTKKSRHELDSTKSSVEEPNATSHFGKRHRKIHLDRPLSCNRSTEAEYDKVTFMHEKISDYIRDKVADVKKCRYGRLVSPLKLIPKLYASHIRSNEFTLPNIVTHA